MDAPQPEKFLPGDGRAHLHLGPPRQEGADLGEGVRLDLGHRALGDHPASAGPSLGAHLDHPVPVG